MLYRIEQFFNKRELNKNHIIVGEVTDSSPKSYLLLCFMKAFLIFIISYSSVMGMLKAFDIPVNKPAVFIVYSVGSLFIASLYLNKTFFYIGYITIFIFYTIELARYYSYANSGFQAVVNIIYGFYSDYFKLMSVREAQELYSNRTVTVTIAAIFVGLFLIILLNVTISGYMNILETMLITLPFFEIAFYISKRPPVIYLFMLIFGYVAVSFLQFSKHARMQVKSRHGHEFVRYKRGKKAIYCYQGNERVFFISFILGIVISLVITLAGFSFYNSKTSEIPTNKIHKATDEYVKIFIQTGLSGFLNGYSSTGGISRGRLGGISQVRPDFEPDINVTFAPYSYETVYLKGFTGTSYINKTWVPDLHVSDEIDSNGETIHNYILLSDFEEINKYRQYPYGNRGKMEIINLDVSPDNPLVPYYSDFDNITYNNNNGFQINSTETITYYPSTSVVDYYETASDALLENADYYEYVYSACTNVPDELKPVLDDVLTEIGYAPYPYGSQSFETGRDRLAAARNIYAYFNENFYYTMSPGSTPVKEDFVTYFLTDQHRGYCVHFASTMVLLLREMGIPARYCEGYCIPISTIYENAVLADEDYTSWYEGSQTFGEETVLSVDVTDANAHAWVEIYLDGYGFVPFEATIPSFDDERNALDFSDFFAGLLSNTIDFSNGEINENNNANIDVTGFEGFLNGLNIRKESVAYVALISFGVIFAFIALLFLYKWSKIRVELCIYRITKNEYKTAKCEYKMLSSKMRRKGYLKKANPLPADVKEAYDRYLFDYNSKHKKSKDIDTKVLFERYEEIFYRR